MLVKSFSSFIERLFIALKRKIHLNAYFACNIYVSLFLARLVTSNFSETFIHKDLQRKAINFLFTCQMS